MGGSARGKCIAPSFTQPKFFSAHFLHNNYLQFPLPSWYVSFGVDASADPRLVSILPSLKDT